MGIALKHQTQLTDRVLGYRSVQVYNYICQQVAEIGLEPTYEMIRKELGLRHRHKVSEIVKRLERRHLVSRVGKPLDIKPGERRLRLIAGTCRAE